MHTTTVLCGLLAAWAALPALDALLRLRRLATTREGARDVAVSRIPGKILAVIPARAEGARVGDLAGDLKREGKKREERISANERETGAGAPLDAALGGVDVLVLLDGPDPDAGSRLERDGILFLSKKIPGPTKGHVMAFLAGRPDLSLNDYDFILVFDADMRLPPGFFRDLRVPEGAEVFQLPVRASGAASRGAPRVEALSLAAALADDLSRNADGLPVRLRGKAMGFSPRAFRLGPAASTRTTVEDSEATLRLAKEGVRVHALLAPVAFDDPPADAGAMSRSRARWFAGHLKLFFTGFADLASLSMRSPKGAFVLACDLWLRPRIFVLLALAILAIGSDLAMVRFSSKGTWSVVLLAILLFLSLEAKLALVFEGLSLAALRRRIGYPPETPPVSLSDVVASLSMWFGAALRGVLAPSKWHRARPPA